MGQIPTVAGPVAPENLGVVLLHEKLLFGLPGWQHAPEVTYDHASAFEQIRSSLELFRKSGGGTIVDATGITLGRDVTFYSRLSEVTGVRIVATTGFGSQPESIPGHFSAYSALYRKSSDPHQHHWAREISGHYYPSHGATVEYLMFLFYNELTEGMAAPGMIRTGIPAGLVKAGTSWDQITQMEELSLRAAAMAAKRAGAAVYTDGAGQSQRQVEILIEEGLRPEQIVVGNCDDARAIDPERDAEIARKGGYVAYDHVGWEDPAVPHSIPDARRVELVKRMVEAGLAEHVVLSCSAIGYAMGVPQSAHGFDHMMCSFVPGLREAGLSQRAIDTILVENPKRILTSEQ